MRKQAEPRRISHRGKLYWASLFNSLPQDLFAPSNASSEDPYALSWRVRPRKGGLHLALSGVLYATAEAVVALACVAEKHRSLSKNAFRMNVDSGPTQWVEALGLTQLVDGRWTQPDEAWSNPSDCHAHSLKRIELKGRNEIATHVAGLVDAIGLLPEHVLGDDRDAVVSSVERVASETLLNIWEHAYSEDRPRVLFVCATVTPSHHFEESPDTARLFTSPQEIAWLSENRERLVLEIAIGDVGSGIPQTLWRSAKERRREFTTLWPQGIFSSSERALAHSHLCDYAFHYDSTRKKPEDFTSAASRLSWRGLHRCLRQTEYLCGCIVLASGQGRAGYAVVGNRLAAVVPTTERRSDLPGTLVVLRFPTRRFPSLGGAARPSIPVQVSAGYFASENDLQAALPSEQIRHVLAGPDQDSSLAMLDSGGKQPEKSDSRTAQATVVCFSFRRFPKVDELIELLENVPPNYLAILLFADVSPEARNDLRAYTRLEGGPGTTSGTPRLLCVWDPDRHNLMWQIAGEIPDPECGHRVCNALEKVGHAELTDEAHTTQELARDLADTYPEYLSWNQVTKSIRLIHAEIALSAEDFATALNVAFKCFMESTSKKPFVFTCAADEAIRIPTGRLVKRFLSVLPMLHDCRTLTAALGQRLFRVLEEIGRPSDIYLLTDGPASYFTATTLLRRRSNGPRVRILDPGAREVPRGTLVLFVDIVFRGDTVRKIVNALEGQDGWSHNIIACVDMRRAPMSPLPGTDCRLHALVTYHQDAEEVKPEDSPGRILEIDSITHVPLGKACEFTELGTTPERSEFLRGRGGLFTVGFHRLSDGQMHTVSLNTGALVEHHEEFVVSAVAGEIDAFLSVLHPIASKCDCVLFCRPESRVYSLLAKVADRVQRRAPRVRRVFVANLAVAPVSPRAIFPREESNLLGDLHVEGGQRSLFPPQLASDFIGVYIDDASITGRSLQDFVAKATRLVDPRPSALLALVLVNRLSPREVRFLDVCRDLQTTAARRARGSSQASMPFAFRSLFRLQVKTTSEGETGHAGEIVRQIQDHADYFDGRLKAYAESIAQRLQQVLSRSSFGSQVRPVVLHPFYPRDVRGSGVDTGVVHLRHLLALNEQNEGVVSEILRQTTELAGGQDVGLLSMLALEPELLDDVPMASACWPAIEEFCLRVIGEEREGTVKSDALAILCRRPDEFLSTLERIFPFLGNEEDLWNQIGAFLLTFSRRDASWLTRIRKCLDAVGGRVDRGTITWLRTILDVPERVESSYVVRDDLEAIARVRSLVAETWTHVGGLGEWQAFDTKVKELEGVALSADALQLGERCMDFADRVLLSGLAGIRFLSEKRLRPGEANHVWGAFIEGNRRAIEIRRMLRDWADGFPADSRRFGHAWNELRRTTIKAASPVRSLGRSEHISSEPSVIEDYLPRLFASAFTLVQGLAKQYVPDLRMDTEESIFREGEGAVLVPVARTLVVDFFRILLENMAKYGRAGDRSSNWILEGRGDESVLRVEFFDRRRSDAVAGEGTGVPLLREFARQGRFKYERIDGNAEYTSIMTFSSALRVYPEIRRR